MSKRGSTPFWLPRENSSKSIWNVVVLNLLPLSVSYKTDGKNEIVCSGNV